MIRVVFDTNIIVLALSGSIQLCVSGSIYAKYEEVIRRPRSLRRRRVRQDRPAPPHT
jgi:predicted nucleic acid-binding protein